MTHPELVGESGHFSRQFQQSECMSKSVFVKEKLFRGEKKTDCRSFCLFFFFVYCDLDD